jgi:hypothetical protein
MIKLRKIKKPNGTNTDNKMSSELNQHLKLLD